MSKEIVWETSMQFCNEKNNIILVPLYSGSSKFSA